MRQKRTIKKAALGALFTFLCSATAANAQIKQYYIGSSGRSEIAVAVRAMADGSSIIAGYSYTNGSTVTNSDMLLLKVKNGVILWQKEWGTSSDDQIQDMMITRHGDIVVVGTVGRSGPASNNTAAIFRFDQGGNLMGQNFVRDTDPGDLGGEVFFGVTEMQNGFLVAVGDHDNRGGVGDALISTFDPGLHLVNSEIYQVDNSTNISDVFEGVVPDPNNPINVYLCGYKYTGNGTHDARIAYYTPPMGTGATGIMHWDKGYDFTYAGLMSNNIFAKIHSVNNTQLVGEGWISSDCCAQYDTKQILFRMDTSAATIDIKVLLNTKTYANDFSYFPVSYDEGYVTEVPSDTEYSATYTGSGTVLNGVVSHFSSLSATSSDFSRQFALPGTHSLIDITDANSTLYMAGGASDDPAVFGGKDIYYVESGLTVKPNGDDPCSLTQNQLGIETTTTTGYPLVDTRRTFTPVAITNLTINDAAMDIKLLCGTEHVDTPVVDTTLCNFQPTKLIVQSTGTDENYNCTFTAIAYAHTTSTVVGYQWTVGGQPTVLHHSGALTDTFTFTVPFGSADSVSILIDAINLNYTAGNSPCCQSAIVTKDASCSTLYKSQGIKNGNGEGSINVYPNPVNKTVSITAQDIQISNIEVMDVSGKVLGSYKYNNAKQADISLSSYTNGTYIIKVNHSISKIISKIN